MERMTGSVSSDRSGAAGIASRFPALLPVPTGIKASIFGSEGFWPDCAVLISRSNAADSHHCLHKRKPSMISVKSVLAIPAANAADEHGRRKRRPDRAPRRRSAHRPGAYRDALRALGIEDVDAAADDDGRAEPDEQIRQLSEHHPSQQHRPRKLEIVEGRDEGRGGNLEGPHEEIMPEAA